jgi:hypothetical protein
MSKCQHEFCSIKPNYNFINEKVGIFCNKHKSVGMVNLKTFKKCYIVDCEKPATGVSLRRGYPICVFHKKENDNRPSIYTTVDIPPTEKCLEHGCSNDAYFCDILSDEKRYCAFHEKRWSLTESMKYDPEYHNMCLGYDEGGTHFDCDEPIYKNDVSDYPDCYCPIHELMFTDMCIKDREDVAKREEREQEEREQEERDREYDSV